MSLTALLFQISATQSDRKRDAAIPLPLGVTECRNISYGSFGKDSLLDVYYPDGTTQPLPTIVSIHGGGYVYGTKEIYRRYGMDMARRGFAFVNFNYRLSPKWKFPAPLADTNAVMEWIVQNCHRYHLDPDNILLVGDSAGAQIASQYAAMVFHLTIPRITLRALGLTCGLYDVLPFTKGSMKGLARDYLGRDFDPADPRLQVLDAIGSNYPPAYITTAANDFLRENAQPMCQLLRSKGIDARWKSYGTPEQKEVAHVFHVNIRLPEAIQCNDEAAEFFRAHIGI